MVPLQNVVAPVPVFLAEKGTEYCGYIPFTENEMPTVEPADVPTKSIYPTQRFLFFLILVLVVYRVLLVALKETFVQFARLLIYVIKVPIKEHPRGVLFNFYFKLD